MTTDWRKKAQSHVTKYKINSISPVYAHINEYLTPNGEQAVSDYEIEYGSIDDYRLIAPIGRGKYSLVFLAKSKSEYCAIKVLRNIAPFKIKRELFILNRLSRIDDVIHVRDVNRDSVSDTISIVTEYIRTDSHQVLYPKLTLSDIRYYMYKLLTVLDACHSRGVMHRDIKPANVCIDHQRSRLCVIDWGLSDLYYPYTQYSVRVSTLRYKAPELLLDYHFYDYGIDIWGAGCVLCEMLFAVGFIEGTTPVEVLASICGLWGVERIRAYCEKYGLEMPACLPRTKLSSWEQVFGSVRPGVRDRDALDLVKKLMEVDHAERITARDALKHRFFSCFN